MTDTGMLAGRVWKFGDGVRVTYFLSGKYDAMAKKDAGEASKHVLEDSDPTFVQNVRKGDLIVAGMRFGQGKHHNNAIRALEHLGIAGVLAESFDAMFHRVCINSGVPAFVFKELPSKVVSGDSIEVDLRAGITKNLTRGTVINDGPVPRLLLAIVESGGLEPYTLRRLREEGFDARLVGPKRTLAPGH